VSVYYQTIIKLFEVFWGVISAIAAQAMAAEIYFYALLRRQLGKTKLQVTIVSLGGVGLGATSPDELYGGVTDKVAIATVRRAVARGINFIDTSPLYRESAEWNTERSVTERSDTDQRHGPERHRPERHRPKRGDGRGAKDRCRGRSCRERCPQEKSHLHKGEARAVRPWSQGCVHRCWGRGGQLTWQVSGGAARSRCEGRGVLRGCGR